eukprot:COSAG01_NODE_1888_length_8979_cov_78.343806_2_plen_205_part_00
MSIRVHTCTAVHVHGLQRSIRRLALLRSLGALSMHPPRSLGAATEWSVSGCPTPSSAHPRPLRARAQSTELGQPDTTLPVAETQREREGGRGGGEGRERARERVRERERERETQQTLRANAWPPQVTAGDAAAAHPRRCSRRISLLPLLAARCRCAPRRRRPAPMHTHTHSPARAHTVGLARAMAVPSGHVLWAGACAEADRTT